MSRAGRADHDRPVSLEYEAFVVRVRIETGLHLRGLRVDVGVHMRDPACDSRDELGIGLARLVGVDLPARVVDAGLEAISRVVEGVLRVAARLRVEAIASPSRLK